MADSTSPASLAKYHLRLLSDEINSTQLAWIQGVYRTQPKTLCTDSIRRVEESLHKVFPPDHWTHTLGNGRYRCPIRVTCGRDCVYAWVAGPPIGDAPGRLEALMIGKTYPAALRNAGNGVNSPAVRIAMCDDRLVSMAVDSAVQNIADWIDWLDSPDFRCSMATIGPVEREHGTGAMKPTGPTSKGEQRAQWLAQAMLLVRDHPEWSDAEIARGVGKDKSTLSRSKEYQVAAAMARGVKDDRHRGHISVDPDSGLRDVEAYSDGSSERDWYD